MVYDLLYSFEQLLVMETVNYKLCLMLLHDKLINYVE